MSLLVRKSSLAALLISAAFLILPSPTPAADCTVTSTADSGAGSLRNCMDNVVGPGDTIDFQFASGKTQTIQLTSGHLVADTADLSITGPTAYEVIVNAAPSSRVFNVTASTTITNLTISGGDAGSIGGGLYANADLEMQNCTVSNNQAGSGGGIAIDNPGDMLLENCVVSNNQATSLGGGIIIRSYTEGSNLAELNSCLISNNTAGSRGGGILCQDSSQLTITASTISDNTVDTYHGGGVYFSSSGSLAISASDFAQNDANGGGGGVYVTSDTTLLSINQTRFYENFAGGENGGYGGGGARLEGCGYVTNCLFENNTSLVSGGAISFNFVPGNFTILNSTFQGNETDAYGGAVLFSNTAGSDTTFHVNYCTVTGNHADNNNDASGSGGGFWKGSGAVVRTKSCVVAQNYLGSGTAVLNDCKEFLGQFTSLGYNLIGVGDGLSGFTDGVNHDHAGTAAAPLDPRLAPLADNGGPTNTRAPLPGSPLINAGGPPINDQAIPVLTDQRGETRLVGPASDIGAYEGAASACAPALLILLELEN